MTRKQFAWTSVPAGMTVKQHQPLVPETLWPLVERASENPTVLLNEFTHTADTKRHARNKTKGKKKKTKKKRVPPKDPMGLAAARDLVRKILRAWIESDRSYYGRIR